MSQIIIPLKELDTASIVLRELIEVYIEELLKKESDVIKKLVDDATNAILRTLQQKEPPRPDWATHLKLEIILPKSGQVGFPTWELENKL